MLDQLAPFNLDLLVLNADMLKTVGQIKVLDIFDTTKSFHNDGLFSTSIFGKQGDEKRNRSFGYIALNTEVLHPLIAKTIFKLKGYYGDIAAGTQYAIFDKSTKDFIKVDPTEGQTGFSFFMRHVKELKFEERESARRGDSIALIYKYLDKLTLKNFLVMPAGLRDYTVDPDGKPSEDEINGMYRLIMALANVMGSSISAVNPEHLDHTRYRLQMTLVEIYDYIVSLLEGKSRLILGKWASRKIYDSSRNVITSWVPDSDELFGPKSVSSTQTVVGLHQYLRNIMPLASNMVRETYLNQVFPGPNSPAILVNKKTLKKEMVQVDSGYFQDWMTYDGFEATVGRFAEEDQRHDYIEVGNHYLGLMYKGPDGTFKFMQDIDEVPEGRDKKHVSPITFAELLYCSTYRISDTIPSFLTRYPVTSYGSIYPTYIYLKSTVKAHVRQELDDTWQPVDGKVANEFPIYQEPFFNSLGPATSHLQRLGADFDGDTCSLISLLTEESKAEIAKKLNSKNFYVAPDGRMAFSPGDDIIDLTLRCITGD